MAICYFTRFYAFFRLSLNKALLVLFYRSLPISFNQVFSLFLCGRYVFVSRFPSLVHGFPSSPGWYFVASIAIDHSGFFEIGLTDTPDSEQIDYYYFSDIQIDTVK